MTTWKGYIYQWVDSADLTDEQNERAHDFMVTEINRLLPDDVTWYESTSEIVLPVEMADTLEIDWQNILETAYENYLSDEDNIIGE
jgi:hypothetical protein